MTAAGGKGHKPTNLGRTLMRRRMALGVRGINADGSLRHTTYVDDTTANAARMRSITEENDLDAFLHTAVLAGTDFTAGAFVAAAAFVSSSYFVCLPLVRLLSLLLYQREKK